MRELSAQTILHETSSRARKAFGSEYDREASKAQIFGISVLAGSLDADRVRSSNLYFVPIDFRADAACPTICTDACQRSLETRPEDH